MIKYIDINERFPDFDLVDKPVYKGDTQVEISEVDYASFIAVKHAYFVWQDKLRELDHYDD